MLSRLYFLVGGPILYRELTRATRGGVSATLRYALVAVFCYEFFSFASPPPDYLSLHNTVRVNRFGLVELVPSAQLLLEYSRQQVLDAGKYVSFLLRQQLLLLLIFTPVVTAGAIVYEKERDTLQALFGTELRSREIVIGKVLGRLVALGVTFAAVLPALAFATPLAGFPAWRVVLALIQAAVLTYALASACLLVSLWTRRTTDAVVGCYATMVVTLLLGEIAWTGVIALGIPGVIATLNPLEVLDKLLDVNGEVPPFALPAHLAFWVAAGTLCLAVATARVRPVSPVQMEKRAPRWLWAFRPPVGDDPVRWREQYVLGLAPIGVLRFIPRWMGRLGVLSFSLILAGDALGHVVGRHVFGLLQNGEFAALLAILQRPVWNRLSDDLNLMGAALLLLGSVTVCLRCAGSIAEERRRKTWEDLILTPLTLAQILRGKYSGVVRAAALPVAVYALPMFALSSLGGWEGLLQATAWVAATGIVLPLAAGLGMMFAEGTEEAPPDGLAAEESLEESPGETPVRPSQGGWGPFPPPDR